MATVLVTGGVGSMGRLVCARLAADGHSVKAFDLASANFDGLPDGVSALPGDLTSLEDVRSALVGVNAVVHLAAIVPPTADIHIELAQKVNVEGTQIIVDAMKDSVPNAGLVFSSSVSVYGTPDNDAEITASQSYVPDDNYAKM